MAKGLRYKGGGWRARVTHDKKAYNTTFDCPNTSAGLKKATKLYSKWVASIVEGSHRVSEPEFGQMAKWYLDTSDLKRSTYQTYRQLLNQYWMPAFATTQVNGIKPRDIRTVLNSFEVSQKTKRNALIPLSRVMELAVEEDYIEANPAASVKVRKHQKPPIQAFTPSQKAKILSKLEGEAWLFYVLAFETGMRTGELLALEWECWSGDTVTVSKSVVRRRLDTLKTYHHRQVYLSPAAVSALSNRPERFAGGYIFKNTLGSHHADADYFTERWRDALQQCRIPYRRAYNCRHTRASEMLMAGVEPAFAARQLGHSVEMFFRTYAEWISGVKDQSQKALLAKL